MKKPIDLAGKRFGNLLALKVSETRNRGVLSWDCICDCVQYREKKIKELNALGYGYSENHGK